MRVVIQRVSSAELKIKAEKVSEIGEGLLVLLGICQDDNEDDIQWLSSKIVNMRIFNDESGKMNQSVKDINGSILLVSQFTLFASTKKGNRPSYMKAAQADVAIPLYKEMIKQLTIDLGKKVQTGVFGADMQICLNNDGPVTITMDSRNKE